MGWFRRNISQLWSQIRDSSELGLVSFGEEELLTEARAADLFQRSLLHYCCRELKLIVRIFSLALYQTSIVEAYQNAVEDERSIASMLTQKTIIGEEGVDSEGDESTKESQSSEPLSAHESRESPDDEEVSTVESGSSSSSSGLSLLSCGAMTCGPAEVGACCYLHHHYTTYSNFRQQMMKVKVARSVPRRIR